MTHFTVGDLDFYPLTLVRAQWYAPRWAPKLKLPELRLDNTTHMSLHRAADVAPVRVYTTKVGNRLVAFGKKNDFMLSGGWGEWMGDRYALPT
jgi:hypothetical protein